MNPLRTRAATLLLAGLLAFGTAACADQATDDGTDTGEGAPPEGGVGEDAEGGIDYS